MTFTIQVEQMLTEILNGPANKKSSNLFAHAIYKDSEQQHVSMTNQLKKSETK